MKHRNEAISSIKGKMYAAVFGSLYAWNSVLPDLIDEDTNNQKYRITISDQEYSKIAKPSIVLFCYHCDNDEEKQIMYDDVKMFNYRIGAIDSNISQKKYVKSWFCPNCHKVNILAKTRQLEKITETKLKEPFYTGVMPFPPVKNNNLSDRLLYDDSFDTWAYSFIAELESASARFRDDNWTKEEQAASYDDDDSDAGER